MLRNKLRGENASMPLENIWHSAARTSRGPQIADESPKNRQSAALSLRRGCGLAIEDG